VDTNLSNDSFHGQKLIDPVAENRLAELDIFKMSEL